MVFFKKNFSIIFIIICVVTFSSCNSKKKVDSIFYNATIYTVNDSFEVCDAIAIHKGKIVFVGKKNDVFNNFESEKRIDLKGKFIYPSFNDAHCHLVGFAGDMYKCDLTETNSENEIIDSLKKYDSQNTLPFIYGRGWDQNKWVKKQFPTNVLLNSFFNKKPVFLKRIDGHAALANDVLLKLAEKKLAPFLNNNQVEKINGKITGILFDKAMEAVESILPKVSNKILAQNILKSQKKCFEYGITSITEPGLNYSEIKVVDSLQRRKLLKLRMNVMVWANAENLIKLNQKQFEKNNTLRVMSLKIFADGALGSRGACLKKPYTDDTSNFGNILYATTAIDSFAKWALKNNYQLCTHAIGDSTVSVVLKIYSKHLKGKNNLRWRIEHAQIVDPIDIHYFYQNNIIASVQPTHATSDMNWACSRLGNDRIRNAYTYGTLKNNGVKLCLGTDFPVEGLNPLHTFYAAVSRKDKNGKPESGFQIEDALTRKSALQGITIDAAFAEFAENIKGNLMVGKKADFVVCDFDILKDSAIKIRNSKVISTYIDGQKVY